MSGTRLADFTTIGLGGPAACLVKIRSLSDLKKAVEAEKNQPVPFFVLGGGSNIVFSDAGYLGTVLKMELSGIEILNQNDDSDLVDVKVAAGEPWDSFVAWTVEHNFQGLECLSGIPGSCGATPIQNVGAYGQEVAESIVSVEVFDTKTYDLTSFDKNACQFSYRDSYFKSVEPGRFIVTAVVFRLKKNGSPDLRYAELKKAALEKDAKTILEIRNLVIEIRRKKGMVVDATDPDSKSCGSFFTNPILPETHLVEVRSRCTLLGIDPESMPVYPYKPGLVKLSAAWLIERSGVKKGFTQNGAGISSKHSLALVNRGGSAENLIEMKHFVQESVQRSFGVDLHPEPILAGF